ncbi:MAG: hypothetical protein HY360_00085 [Verrucomicrobia bacterium]|nr:hypothetical protein [Verrucomicrobiota bacterium]
MPHAYTEDQLVEKPAIGLFTKLGWGTVSALEWLNPTLPPDVVVWHFPGDCPLLRSRETSPRRARDLAPQRADPDFAEKQHGSKACPRESGDQDGVQNRVLAR